MSSIDGEEINICMKTLREYIDLIEGSDTYPVGGVDNAGGQSHGYTDSDGTYQTLYVPGEKSPSTYKPSEVKPEPTHPLKGHTVVATYGDKEITGKLLDTSTTSDGTVAKIRDKATGLTYFVDAKTIRRKGKTEQVEEDAADDVAHLSREMRK